MREYRDGFKNCIINKVVITRDTVHCLVCLYSHLSPQMVKRGSVESTESILNARLRVYREEAIGVRTDSEI